MNRHHLQTTSRTFTYDWFSPNIPFLGRILESVKGRPHIAMLEIGCFEGRSTVWFLENILTGQGSFIDVIDTFGGSQEHKALGIDFSKTERQFIANTESLRDRVRKFKGDSHKILRTLPGPYRVVYVDGSHIAEDVRQDAELSWPLLAPEGMIIFDDYEWPSPGLPHDAGRPKLGIDTFIADHQAELRVLEQGYQMAVQKR